MLSAECRTLGAALGLGAALVSVVMAAVLGLNHGLRPPKSSLPASTDVSGRAKIHRTHLSTGAELSTACTT
ncbi:hypothetical protein DMH04_22245 [Kibdelosporangium aridum]|uniref:Uncharacterized protein n=1 Tax=Kibdelosporangium aridum TaxID=2030 RepID=A0A428Z7V5_KIBAR|nr:hypothetical protein DMH04_22245 [Kibdelosporangium aridum]